MHARVFAQHFAQQMKWHVMQDLIAMAVQCKIFVLQSLLEPMVTNVQECVQPFAELMKLYVMEVLMQMDVLDMICVLVHKVCIHAFAI